MGTRILLTMCESGVNMPPVADRGKSGQASADVRLRLHRVHLAEHRDNSWYSAQDPRFVTSRR